MLLRRALDRGACGAHDVPDDVVAFLAARAGGDARTALAALELACETAAEGEPITLERAEDALQRRALTYDKKGDRHYDTISAWIKATRGSDPDASLYYLAVMIEAGEDPRFIVRRMVVLASEDVGNADPQALQVAVNAAHAVEHVGMPEASYALAQCAIYLSLAPKSNAAGHALGLARAHVREHGALPPPPYLQSAAYPGAAALGRGVGYDYPHDNPDQVSEQELLPDRLVGTRFYEPTETEAALRERLEAIRRARRRSEPSGTEHRARLDPRVGRAGRPVGVVPAGVRLVEVGAEALLPRPARIDLDRPAVHDDRELLAAHVRRADRRARADVAEPRRALGSSRSGSGRGRTARRPARRVARRARSPSRARAPGRRAAARAAPRPGCAARRRRSRAGAGPAFAWLRSISSSSARRSASVSSPRPSLRRGPRRRR